MNDFSLRPLDPTADQELVHRWVTEPRARYWGMTDKSPEEVSAIYAWLQEQDHLAAYVVEASGAPVGIFQTYDPFVDEIGQYYDRRPGDLGVHILLADTPARAGHTARLLRFLVDRFASRPGVHRIVVEPDAANLPSVSRVESLGFSRGPVAHLPDKTAQFLFLDVP